MIPVICAVYIYVLQRQNCKQSIYSCGELGIRPDHPRHPIEIPFGMVGGLLAVVISFKFRQNRLSGYRAVRGRNLADLIS